MKKTLIVGTIIFTAWVLMWAVVRPFVDYVAHGQEVDITHNLISGSISGVIFAVLAIFVFHISVKKKVAQ